MVREIMENENRPTFKATVLLEHHEGDKRWSANVLPLDNCFAEGATPEEATENVEKVLKDLIREDPQIMQTLKEQPKYLVTEIDVKSTP